MSENNCVGSSFTLTEAYSIVRIRSTIRLLPRLHPPAAVVTWELRPKTIQTPSPLNRRAMQESAKPPPLEYSGELG